MSVVLEINNLSKAFDGVQALDQVSLSVEARQIVGLIGPNGAGKTTLFNLVCGFLPASGGRIVLTGREIAGLSPHRIARRGLGRTFQDLRLLRRVSVLDNVMLAFQRQAGEAVWQALVGRRMGREERANARRARELLAFVGLAGKADDPAEALSYGQQKLLTIACCLAMQAEILLLDEPVAGIDPEMTQRIMELLVQLRGEGKAMLVIEHNLEAVKAISDTVVVLDEGRKIAEGRPEAVMCDPVVVEAYLT